MDASDAERHVLRSGACPDPAEDAMEFRLTYAGPFLAHRNDSRLRERNLHVHALRKVFHKQLRNLWNRQPYLKSIYNSEGNAGIQRFMHDGFEWLPLVTRTNGLICRLEILMLRAGEPGNRVKTIFDALRKAHDPDELGRKTNSGMQTPDVNENPFFVLLEDDSLITHVAVSTDMILEDQPSTPSEDFVRLILAVKIYPYDVKMWTVPFF